MVWMVGAAIAAPTTTTLSSWESTVVEGQIVGGDRTVVVTNTTGERLPSHAIDLGPAPCDCVIAEASSNQTVTDNTWSVPELQVGETASLTLRYDRPEIRVSAAGSSTVPGSIAIVAATMMAITVGLAVAGRPRLALDF